MGNIQYYLVFYLDSNTAWNYNLLTGVNKTDQEYVHFQLANKLYYFSVYIISNHTKSQMFVLLSVEKIKRDTLLFEDF